MFTLSQTIKETFKYRRQETIINGTHTTYIVDLNKIKFTNLVLEGVKYFLYGISYGILIFYFVGNNSK